MVVMIVGAAMVLIITSGALLVCYTGTSSAIGHQVVRLVRGVSDEAVSLLLHVLLDLTLRHQRQVVESGRRHPHTLQLLLRVRLDGKRQLNKLRLLPLLGITFCAPRLQL